MRVCHIWQNFFPLEAGGLEHYILNLSNFLSQQDPDMRFLLLTDKSSIPLLRSLKIPKCQNFDVLKVFRLRPNIISVFRGVFRHSFRLDSKLVDRIFIEQLYREAANWREIQDVDVFHVHGIWEPQYPIIGLLLSRRFHKPLVVSLHGDVVKPSPSGMSINTPEVLTVLKSADVIITFSREIFNILKKFGLAYKSRLIPNFVDSRKFIRPTSVSNTSGNRLVMVSRLDSFKDPITPILAFQNVKKEVPGATFQIVGYGPLYDHINRLLQDLNLKESVTLAGKHTDVRKFLWNSDIFVATKSYISVLEAWAAGLAVIAPKFGVLKELIHDNLDGILVSPGNIEQFSSAMITLLKNKKLRKTLAINGMQNVQKYDIGCVARQIADIYNSLLK